MCGSISASSGRRRRSVTKPVPTITKSASCVSPPAPRMRTPLAVRLDRLPGAAGVQVKAGVPPRALERIGRRQLPHAQDLPDEAPLVGVGEIAGVLQEADGLGPAIGVDVDQRRAAKAEAHLARAVLQRGRRVVERRRARAQHRDALAGERGEVDLPARVRVAASAAGDRGSSPARPSRPSPRCRSPAPRGARRASTAERPHPRRPR